MSKKIFPACSYVHVRTTIHSEVTWRWNQRPHFSKECLTQINAIRRTFMVQIFLNMLKAKWTAFQCLKRVRCECSNQIPDRDRTVRWMWLYFELSVSVLILWIKLQAVTLLTTNLYHKQYHRSAQTAIKYTVQWRVTRAIAGSEILVPYYKAWSHKTSRRRSPL